MTPGSVSEGIEDMPLEVESLAKILDSLPHAVLVVGRDLRVAVHNERSQELLQTQFEKLQGAQILDVISCELLAAQIREVREKGGTKEFEFRLERVDGAHKVLSISLAPVGADHVSLVLQDASEQVQRENELVQLEKLTAMRQLGRSVAHELGNPLSVMHSALVHVHDTLRARDDQELVQYTEAILDNVTRMSELLRTLSDFNRAPPARFEPSDVGCLITDLVTFIRMEAQRRGVAVCLGLSERSPTCLIDVRRMKQVFLNLFKNAMEAMPDGGTLEIASDIKRFKDEERLAITVRDTGVGIPEDGLRVVFRPLQSTKPGGMGLGLSFCREVLEEHYGDIRVDSREGAGTTVGITLPIA